MDKGKHSSKRKLPGSKNGAFPPSMTQPKGSSLPSANKALKVKPSM